MPELPLFDGTEYPEQQALQVSLERQVGVDPYFGTDEMVISSLKTFKNLIEKSNSIDVKTNDLRHAKFEVLLDDFRFLKQKVEEHLGIGLMIGKDAYISKKDPSGQYGEMFSRLTAFGVLKDLPTISDSEEMKLKDSIDFSNPNEISCKYIFPLYDTASGKTICKVCEVIINRYQTQEEIDKKFSDFQSKAKDLQQKHRDELANFYKKYGKISRATVPGTPSRNNDGRRLYRIRRVKQ